MTGAWTMADWRLHFDERAAILEHDAGLPRTEAEKQALAEIYDRLAAHGPRTAGILGELVDADRRRQHPELAPLWASLGLNSVRAPNWGVGWVEPEGSGYRPTAEGEVGRSALIVPAFEYGSLVDLIAFGLASRRMRSRLGVVSILGIEEVERARESGAPLLIFESVVGWLKGHRLGAVIVDWADAAHELDGVSAVLCSPNIAGQLHSVVERLWHPPTIAVLESKEMRHAA